MMDDNSARDNLASENKSIYPTVTITHAGVIRMPGYDSCFMVNQDDIMQELSCMIDSVRPKKDYNGNFSGSVTITVELMGDLEAEA